MAELDVAKRRKAFRDDTSWIDVIPHGILSYGSGNVDKRLGGDSLSPRQSHVQPNLAPTKNVNMQDLYDSEEWKNATPKQRQDFISKVRADMRIERERAVAEARKKKRDSRPAPQLSGKPTKAQRRAAAQLKKQIRRIDKPKEVKRRVKVSGIDVISTEFLSTYEWRKVRMVALKKYGPICKCCGATPASGAVMNVDHVKPRRLFPHLALDVNNLQVLCHECNHGKGNWDQTDWR